MNSIFESVVKDKEINFKETNLCKYSEEGSAVTLLTNGSSDGGFFSGTVVYSEDPAYSVGEFRTDWLKMNFSKIENTDRIILTN